MHVPFSIFLPIVGGIYGGIVGAYIHSKNKSPKRKRALWIAGILLVVLCVVVISIDLTK